MHQNKALTSKKYPHSLVKVGFLLDLGVTGSVAEIQKNCEIGFKNFYKMYCDQYDNGTFLPIYSEGGTMEATVYDSDGDPLPLQLSGIMDRIDETADGDLIVIDYKTVGKFEENVRCKYDLQAGAYFFACKEVTGKYPRKIQFHEILKNETGLVWLADPSRRMLQKDLKEEATKAGLEYGKYVKNDELKAMLQEKGLIVQRKVKGPLKKL